MLTHKVLYYTLLVIIIVVVFFLFHIIKWETGSKRSIIQSENTVHSHINTFLCRINENRPITRSEMSNFCAEDNDTIFFVKYNIDKNNVKYSFIGELIRLNHHIFDDILHNSHTYNVLPSQKGFEHNNYVTMSAMILTANFDTLIEPSKGKLYIFPVHLANLRIYITGIRVGTETLLESIGINSDGSFKSQEKEKDFFVHMVKLDPDLKENQRIDSIIK